MFGKKLWGLSCVRARASSDISQHCYTAVMWAQWEHLRSRESCMRGFEFSHSMEKAVCFLFILLLSVVSENGSNAGCNELDCMSCDWFSLWLLVWLRNVLHLNLQRMRSGSTGVAVLLAADWLTVSWLGDSQAMLVKKGEPVILMDPHKPEREVTHTNAHIIDGQSCTSLSLRISWLKTTGTFYIALTISSLIRSHYIVPNCTRRPFFSFWLFVSAIHKWCT